MKKSNLLLLIVVVILAIGLTACERSASTPPPDASVGEGEFPLPVEGTASPIEELTIFATQTAMALNAGGEQVADEGEVGADAAAEAVTGEEGQAAETGETAGAADAGGTEAGSEAVTGGDVGGGDAEAGGGQEGTTTTTTSAASEYETPSSYVLEGGEFPFCIARRFDIDISTLLNASGLAPGGTYYAGTKLTIPADAKPFNGPRALRAHPVSYKVVAGDTVNSIACLFGDVDPRAIIDENGLGGGTALSAGQDIKIP